MITCPTCRLQNHDTAKFCQGCGARLIGPATTPVVHQRQDEISIDTDAIPIKTIVCPHCRKDTLPDIDTCVHCGKSLTQLPGQPFPFQPPLKKADAEKKQAEERKVEAEVKKEALKKREAEVKKYEELKKEEKPKPEPEPEQPWEVVTCPSCGKKTRTNRGYCLICKADLSGKPLLQPQVEPKPVSEPQVVVSKPAVETKPKPELKPQPKPVGPIPVAPAAPEPVSKVEAVTKPEPPLPSPSPLRIIIPLILFLFILLVAVLGVVLLVKMGKKVPILVQTPPASELQAMQPKTDSAAIYTVFETVRDAMLSKDTELLMSCYSPQYPDYQGKLNDTEELIKSYDIVSLTFSIDSPAMKIATDKAELTIKWQIKLRKYDDGATLSAVDSNYVVLSKENNRWKISQVFQR
ncbi:MAG: zinc ribbon domain-containing protein [bacterium]|nr:zinc ribbon domain-containing protein [bacterium]